MQEAFRAEMASAQESALESALEAAVDSAVCVSLVEVHLFLCVSSISPDCLYSHFGKEGNYPLDFDKASLGVLLLQPSPCYALETEHLPNSLVRLQCEVS